MCLGSEWVGKWKYLNTNTHIFRNSFTKNRTYIMLVNICLIQQPPLLSSFFCLYFNCTYGIFFFIQNQRDWDSELKNVQQGRNTHFITEQRPYQASTLLCVVKSSWRTQLCLFSARRRSGGHLNKNRILCIKCKRNTSFMCLSFTVTLSA